MDTKFERVFYVVHDVLIHKYHRITDPGPTMAQLGFDTFPAMDALLTSIQAELAHPPTSIQPYSFTIADGFTDNAMGLNIPSLCSAIDDQTTVRPGRKAKAISRRTHPRK